MTEIEGFMILVTRIKIRFNQEMDITFSKIPIDKMQETKMLSWINTNHNVNSKAAKMQLNESANFFAVDKFAKNIVKQYSMFQIKLNKKKINKIKFNPSKKMGNIKNEYVVSSRQVTQIKMAIL